MSFRSARSRRARLLLVAAVLAMTGMGLGDGIAMAESATSAIRPAVSHSVDPAKHHDKDDDKKKDDKKKDKDSKKDKAKGEVKAGSPCELAAKACVDLSSHQAWLTDGAGHVTYGPVSAQGGGKGAKTPTGSFSVISKDAHYFSNEFKAPMPYSVFFYPGDAFHAGNPSAASNGCVHLSPGSAQRFFAALNPGDPVQIKS